MCIAPGAEQLELALDQLYPGGVVDAWAARVDPPPVTQYRDFVGRQTGMYRVAQNLTDAEVSEVIRASCGVRQCLKRRRWTVDGVREDSPDTKSDIACLEPCALFLECARRAARLAQEATASLGLVEPDRAVWRPRSSSCYPIRHRVCARAIWGIRSIRAESGCCWKSCIENRQACRVRRQDPRRSSERDESEGGGTFFGEGKLLK